MKISFKWLQEFIDLPSNITPEMVADKLTFSGIEVEEILRQDKGLEKVVIGEILERTQHPNADRLSLTKINIGANEPLSIVCGAQNIKVGQKIPVATIGAQLPNGIEIKAAKIRNVASQGMLCSLDELCLPKDWQAEDGIYLLDPAAKVGTPIAAYLGRSDNIFILGITPNRGDCLSHLGIAREVSALFGLSLKNIETKSQEVKAPAFGKISNFVGNEFCSQYFGRYIEGVKVGPSPDWLKQKIECIGLRSINNIVDITALVMMEMGQPLHAFDADKIAESGGIHVSIRFAKDKEQFETLTDKKVELLASDIVIAAGQDQRAIALAGVMGGKNSEVSDTTKNIFLESAEFNPISVRKTGRRMSLLTDAGYRFERGVDSGKVQWAIHRATDLILQLAGGKPHQDICDPSMKELAALPQIRLRLSEVQKVLGRAPELDLTHRIFRSLGFTAEIAAGEPGVILVQVPRWRKDIKRSADLIEEVGRIWGYENLQSRLPLGGIGAEEPKDSKRRTYFQVRRIRRHLTSLGFFEALNHGFTSRQELESVFHGDELTGLVELANPVSEDFCFMKPSLVSGLLKNAAHNFSHKRENIRLFEVRRVFRSNSSQITKLETGIDEKMNFAMVLAGADMDESWDGKSGEVDFFHLKGILESIFDLLNLNSIRFETGTSASFLHPGQSARLILGNKDIGFVGRVHPRVEKSYKFERGVYLAELDLDRLLQDAAKQISFKPYGNQPPVERDFSVLVKDSVNSSMIRAQVTKSAKPLLKDFRFFDVYKGSRVPEGHISYAFRVILSADDHTLADAEITATQEKIMKDLETEFQGKFAGLS